MINERISKLRKMMAKRNIDAYIVPSSDPHQSEYLADYYKTREFITGFTGSAGTAVITTKKSGLWTDGRYFIQAAKELAAGEVELYKTGLPESISIEEFLLQEFPNRGKIAFDGNNTSVAEYENLIKKLPNFEFITDVDYVGEIWNEEGRPASPDSKVYIFDEKYAGESTSDRLARLRAMMKERGIDYHFIGSLDDIAYVLNIRANDVQCNPVVISYLLVSDKACNLYIDKSKLSEEVANYLKENNVCIKPYEVIGRDVSDIEARKTLYLEPRKTNVAVYSSIARGVNIVTGTNLTSLMKCHKNEIEIKNTKNAYIKDGVALVRFLNWLETGIPTGTITEMIASEKLLEF